MLSATFLTAAVSIASALSSAATVLERVSPTERVAASQPFRESMRRAIERAQEGLEQSLELYVDRSTWDNPWIARSEHYEVRSTANLYFTRRTADQLEDALDFFQEMLLSDYEPTQRFGVWVFPDLDGYRDYGNANGAEHSSFYGSYYASSAAERVVATYQYPYRNLLRIWILHSALHQFLDAAYERSLPLWIEEGLASYAAIHDEYTWAVGELRRVRSQRGRIPFSTLLSNNLADYTQRPEDRVLELGMFFVYLFYHHPETRTVRRNGEVWQAPLSEYFDAVLTGDDAQYHPLANLFTREGLAAIERDYANFEFP